MAFEALAATRSSPTSRTTTRPMTRAIRRRMRTLVIAEAELIVYLTL
jgi:hypothetical protein